MVPSAGAAELPPNEIKGLNQSKSVKEMNVEELAALIEQLQGESKPDEVQGIAFDSEGGGRFFTNDGVYSVGDWYDGHKIIRIVKDGYLYLDEEGTLSKQRFRMRPKPVVSDLEKDDQQV